MLRFLLALGLLVSLGASAQLPKATFTQLRKMEDTMKRHARSMIVEKTALQRFMADSAFIKTLVRSLKMPHSFNYPFDSLETVSRLYAPDSSFRIFSWEFSRDENYYRQRGAIQMRTADGSLKLFPLLDVSEFTNAPDDSVRTAQNWIGAIYYSIIMKTYNGKNYYTLFGFDGNNMRSTKKWIEVLSFDDQTGKPAFGGPFFTVHIDAKMKGAMKQRFCVEYKKEGRARVNYDRELEMIVYDHLVSETNEPDKKFTLIPDGDYEGFKWVDGKWAYVSKVFNFKLEDGQAPMPEPLKDANGRNNEAKLLEQSKKNKATETQTPKKTLPKKEAKKPVVKDDNEY